MLQIRLGRTLIGLGLLALPAAVSAADLGERIATKGKGSQATACQTCHQADGSGNAAAGFPRLAGMNADYMVKQLRDIAAGERDNAVMNPIASGLSEEEMRAAAEYYAAMEAPAQAPGSAEAEGGGPGQVHRPARPVAQGGARLR